MVQYNKLKTCKSCRRLFESTYDRELCPVCYEQTEERFEKVRKYIKKHEQAGVEEVSEACLISKRQILQWVREERLYFTEESGVGIPCMQCGVIISTGKYCISCKAKIRKELQGVYVAPKPDDEEVLIKPTGQSKMRFMSKDKKR